ncbi:probable ATP-dependent RNA helicase DHX35 [Rhopilema esculentum]|uniref:probable ATP-dependent RNA helicase DHX35 n=1 Tax=Rhopilema esculentum TaxID=499914 RepID=UPI0031CF44FE
MASNKSVLKFWKPGGDAPGSSVHLERSEEGDGAGTFFRYNPNISLSIQKQRQELPVFKYRNHILYLIEKFQTVVLVGETGSGKTTQVPQYLHEAGWTKDGKIVGVTQPRRVAATKVTERVAEEMGVFVGEDVGYAIRFDNCTDPDRTRIKFMTDGYLLREMMSDPLLSKYSVIILDEAHERTLYTDIISGLLKKIMKKREDLRLIVSSATLDAQEFHNFFNFNHSKHDSSKDSSVIMTVEGRMFPVDIFYIQSPVPDYLKATVETVLSIHKDEPVGDVLAFLTGQDEVEHVVSQLRDEAANVKLGNMKLMVLPMYGGLPIAEQLKVFQRTPHNTRKVVVATNIAEASITINGIVYVVDSGFVKLKAYNATSGIESLVVVPLSKASAEQRAGRAGRVRAGKAYRLYTEDSYLDLEKRTCPEMQRSDLAPVIIQLKSLGISNVLRFPFLSRPPAQCMVRGLELLYALGAVNESGDLTDPLGLRMAELPVGPMFAKMLLNSGEFGCSEEALQIAAMLQLENIFIIPHNKRKAADHAKLKFSVHEGDHLTLLNVYRAFVKYNKNSKWCHENFLNFKALSHAVRIKGQLEAIMKRYKVPVVSCEGDDEKIRKCILSGFFANVAKYHPAGEYRTVRDDHSLHLHPQSVLSTETPPQWVVFNQVLLTGKEYMRDVTVIDPDWLLELAPHYYEYGTERSVMSKRARLET